MAGGYLIKLNPLTLEEVPHLAPIPITANSWSMASPDGFHLVNFDWDERADVNYVRTIDVQEWQQVSAFELGPNAGQVINETTIYSYDQESGRLSATDLRTGLGSVLAEWPSDLWFWDNLQVISDDRIAALGARPFGGVAQAEYSVFVFEPGSRATKEFPLGSIERIDESSGVFEAGTEIPEVDTPGVVWAHNRVLLVYCECSGSDRN